jgi:hypothetical protein
MFLAEAGNSVCLAFMLSSCGFHAFFMSIGILCGWRQDVKRDPSVLRRNMKSLRSVARLVPVVAVSVALLCGLAAAAETGPTLSKKELKALLATAQTPSDHQKIAAYYSDKAKRLNAKAQEFSAQAEFYAARPATVESKQGISCLCTSHFRYWAKVYAQEAKDSEALAEQHGQLAH